MARGASYLIIQNTVTSASMVVSFAILARLITVEEMGIMAVLLLVIGSCEVAATLGLRQATTRFIAKESALSGAQAATSIFYQALRTTFLLAVPLAVFVFVGADILSAQLLGTPSEAVFFRILAFDVTLYAGLLPVLEGAMLGLQKFKETAGLHILNVLVRQFLIIFLVLSLKNFLGLVVAWVLADLAAAYIYMSYLLRLLGRPRFDFAVRPILGFSWPLYVSNAVSFTYDWFDRALLLLFVPLGTLGVYNATIIAYQVLTGMAGAIATTLFSAYSAMQTRGRQGISDAIYLSSRHVSLIAIPLAFGLLVTAKPALALFVGPAYEAGAESLMLLAGVSGVALVGTVLSPVLLALGETRAASAVTITSLCVGLASSYILVPLFGMLGAASARGLAMALSTLLTIVVLRRTMTFHLDIELIAKSLTAGLFMALAVWVTEFVAYDRYLLPLYVLIGAATYGLMLRILRAMRHDDLRLIRSCVGERFGWVADLIGRIVL